MSRPARLMTPMKFRADIRIDFEEQDFLGAAEQQRRIQGLYDQLKEVFPASSLDVRQVRFAATGSRPRRVPADAGRRAARYED